MTENKVREITAEEVIYDDRNLNRHTEKGRELVIKSFSELGAGRSGVSDKHGKMIAGNLSAETAIEKGLKLLEIETDGDTYVIVKRNDLDLDSTTDNRARKLALADNSTSAVSLDWNFEEMAEQETEFGFDVAEWGIVAPGEIGDLDGFFQSDPNGHAPKEEAFAITLNYTEDEFRVVKDALAKVAQTPEQAVWQLLNLEE